MNKFTPTVFVVHEAMGIREALSRRLASGGYRVRSFRSGILLKKDTTVGYYNTAAVSYGLQAGVQTYGYVLFFMSEDVMRSFENSDGWEIGVGPSIVVVDAGMAKDLTTITGKADIYSFIFDQK